MEATTQSVSSGHPQLSRETVIGVLAGALSVALMVTEQLMGSSPGLEDPTGLVVNTALLVVGGYVFAVAVPRIKIHPACSGLATPFALVLSLIAVPTMFVALPFTLCGGAIALGLIGRRNRHGWLADVAIGIGGSVAVLALGYLASAGITA